MAKDTFSIIIRITILLHPIYQMKHQRKEILTRNERLSNQLFLLVNLDMTNVTKSEVHEKYILYAEFKKKFDSLNDDDQAVLKT